LSAFQTQLKHTTIENGPIRVLAAPRRALRLRDAASYIGVSARKFQQLVAEGQMPKSFKLHGCVLWDIRRLDEAIDCLSDTDDSNPWD
jgi:predicted DNA-binding transcriptional regulator AlpA